MKKTWKYLYLAVVYLFLYLPMVFITVFSFNNANRSVSWQGFTWQWYEALLNNNALTQAVWHSLLLGMLAATSAVLLALLISISLFRYQFFGKKLLHGLIFILVMTPEIVMAVSLLLLYSVFKIPLGFWSLLLAHISLGVPFAAITIYSRIADSDPHIFEAAVDLGAGDFTIFTKIIIPLLLPAILVGWLLCFTLSVDNIILSYFVSGPAFTTLPLKIYSMVRTGVKPEINALCSLMMLFTLFTAIVSYKTIFNQSTNQ